ncbi:MAG: shikimate kinase [Acidobacteriota bacterium]
MDNYYDPSPLLVLRRPLTLVSYPEAGHRMVGYQLAARTGLPFVDLDRATEHEAGMNQWQVLQEHGEEGLRQLEIRSLDRALRQPLPAIISLGDRTLMHAPNLERVLAESDLVYLHFDLANYYWHLRKLEESRGRLTHPFLPHPLDSIDALRPVVDARAPGFQRAPHRQELAGQHPAKIAQRLQRELLPLLSTTAVGALNP